MIWAYTPPREKTEDSKYRCIIEFGELIWHLGTCGDMYDNIGQFRLHLK
jgi:hypothetical protein